MSRFVSAICKQTSNILEHETGTNEQDHLEQIKYIHTLLLHMNYVWEINDHMTMMIWNDHITSHKTFNNKSDVPVLYVIWANLVLSVMLWAWRALSGPILPGKTERMPSFLSVIWLGRGYQGLLHSPDLSSIENTEIMPSFLSVIWLERGVRG